MFDIENTMLSISKTKNVGGRPRTDATPVMVRMPPADLARLDAWIAGQPEPRPSRPEAIRIGLRLWLDNVRLATRKRKLR